MYKNKTIGVIVRAYNEEQFIGGVIDSVPDFVDRIYVVNDASTDKTVEKILERPNHHGKVILINQQKRGGAGSAAIAGHKRSVQDKNDIIVMLDGDGQMDSSLLSHFLEPLILGEADFVKGNRLSKPEHRKEMPPLRALGNFLLTSLTRIASGYWYISDPQNGYTAISVETLKKLNLDKLEKGFAFENDVLVKLNVAGARVKDIPHPAIYRGQHSKINYSRFIIRTSWVLLKDYFWRIWAKYLRKNNGHVGQSIEAT